MSFVTPVMCRTTGPAFVLPGSCLSLVGEEDEVAWTDWPGEIPGGPLWAHSLEGPAKIHRLAGLFAVARSRKYQGYPYSILWHEQGHDLPILWPPLLLSMILLPLGLLRCSPQELRVMAYLGQGHSPKEIARRLGTRLPTVHTYLSRLRGKLDCEDILSLTALAGRTRMGVLPDEECQRIW